MAAVAVAEDDDTIEVGHCRTCAGTVVACEWDNVDWGEEWDQVPPEQLTVWCNNCSLLAEGKDVLNAQ